MKKTTLLISVLLVGVLAGICVIRIKVNRPPDEEIQLARKMLAEAKLLNSPRYAKELYSEALGFYDSAMAEWNRENERIILLRNYILTAEFAGKSSESSRRAMAVAKMNISNLEKELEPRITGLGQKIKDFEHKFGAFPMESKQREEILGSKLKYAEALLAFENKNYPVCQAKLDSAEFTLSLAFLQYEQLLTGYLNENSLWSEMLKKTISHSRKHKTYCIVVDKLARECILYKDGEIQKVYSVELGANWIGDKHQQGDKSTPEGYYKITEKKSRGQTSYYKALMLDYPNEEDQVRFLQKKKNGQLRPDAKIGNHIEIHGHGGKGADWTDGCIALRDEDMDAIFKHCSPGTWVTIVGSAVYPLPIERQKDES